MSENETEAKVVTRKKVEGVTKESVVTVLAESNPKREGSKAFDRFDHYFSLVEGDTVQTALDAGLTMGDIHYDFIRGNIEVEGASVVEYTPEPRTPKAESEGADTEDESEGADTEEASAEGF